MIEIELRALHIEFAETLARRRQSAAIKRMRPARNGAPFDGSDALQYHRLGCFGEAAAKVFLNPVTWNAFAADVSDLPDLDDFIDVKTCRKASYRLIVQQDSPPNWASLLVCSERHPIYTMVGWAWGHEAKKPEHWCDPNGDGYAFFVPQRLLHPPEELIDVLRERQRERDTTSCASRETNHHGSCQRDIPKESSGRMLPTNHRL